MNVADRQTDRQTQTRSNHTDVVVAGLREAVLADDERHDHAHRRYTPQQPHGRTAAPPCCYVIVTSP